jgi:hypothetical protein
MSIYTNVFPIEEIDSLHALPQVMAAKARLEQMRVVYFTIPLTPSLRATLRDTMGMDLDRVEEIPMRWIQGDTPHHVDVGGSSPFENTYLVYLNDSDGELVLGTNEYPITANTGFVFQEGVAHQTQNTGHMPRLLVGPMNEFAVPVGATSYINYYANESDALAYTNPIGFSADYTVDTVNGGQVWNMASNSTGTSSNTNTYSTGDELNPEGFYYLFPVGLLPSNVCFPAQTPILTDAHGHVAIAKLDPAKHTIRGNKIVAITETLHISDQLVSFAKNALGPNMPSETTVMSPNHKVMWGGHMKKAKEFVRDFSEVSFVPYDGKPLYNVLLETHGKMMVNNMVCETLDPDHGVARLSRLLKTLSPQQQQNVLRDVATRVTQKRLTR